MPLDGSGNYALPTPAYPAVSGELISSSRYNEVLADIRTVLSKAFYRDGQAEATADWNLNSKRLTNLAAPTVPTDAANLASVTTAATAAAASAAAGVYADLISTATGKGDTLVMQSNGQTVRSNSPLTIWRQRPSLVGGGTAGTPAENVTRLQAQINALYADGGGTLRLVEGTIQVDGTLLLPRGVSVVGPGKNRCLIQNVRTGTSSPYGDSLFMPGNFHPAYTTNLFGHALSKAINAVTSGDAGVTLTTSGDAAGFVAGDIVLVFDSANYYLDGGGNKISYYMAVRRVLSVSGAIVYLDEPLRETIATGALYNLRTGTIPGHDPNGTGFTTPLFSWGDAEISGFSVETRRYLIADGCAYKGLFADIEMRTCRNIWYGNTYQHSLWDGVGGRFHVAGGEMSLNSEMTEVRNFKASYDAVTAAAYGASFYAALSFQENGMDITYKDGSIDCTGAYGGNVVQTINFLRATVSNVKIRSSGAGGGSLNNVLSMSNSVTAGRRANTQGNFKFDWDGPSNRYIFVEIATTGGHLIDGTFKGTVTASGEAFRINNTLPNTIAPTCYMEQGKGTLVAGTTGQEIIGCYVGGGLTALTSTDYSTLQANNIRGIRTAKSVARRAGASVFNSSNFSLTGSTTETDVLTADIGTATLQRQDVIEFFARIDLTGTAGTKTWKFVIQDTTTPTTYSVVTVVIPAIATGTVEISGNVYVRDGGRIVAEAQCSLSTATITKTAISTDISAKAVTLKSTATLAVGTDTVLLQVSRMNLYNLVQI